MSDIMTGEPPGESVLSLSRYPEPACSYDFLDGTPVVRHTNDAFESTFGWSTEEVVGR